RPHPTARPQSSVH
ncbi:unnamed protein product, partial [Ophioblennius macclurei]